MYTIYIKNGKVVGDSWHLLHNPMRDLDGLVVISPTLTEGVNAHGSLEFQIAETNPLYDNLSERITLVKVQSDTKNRKIWFGRVMSIERGMNNVLSVYCEGELGCLCDSMHRPFGFQDPTRGEPQHLLSDLIEVYNGSNTIGFPFVMGNVSVTDPNNQIVRSSVDAMNVWDRIKDTLWGTSLGGYIIPRYDEQNDIHYIDYLALDDNDTYSHTSSQVVEFGRNLLNFVRKTDVSNIITVLIPYGAQIAQNDPPTSGTWDGNRLTIKSVNNNRDYIENEDGKTLWGRIVGSRTWDDVTIASNLLSKAATWLATQIAKSITIEASAVDLAFANADIDQIQVGDYVRVKSKPHGLNTLLLCTKKTTALTSLENSGIALGAGSRTITDLQTQQKEVH